MNRIAQYHIFWIVLLLLAFFLIPNAHSGSLEFYTGIGSDHGGKFPEAKLIAAMDDGPYGFLSYSSDRFWYDLPGEDFGYYGVGVGYRHPIWRDILFLYGEVGVYIPDMDYQDESGPMAACNNEALYQLLNDKYLLTHKQYDPNKESKNIWFDIYELRMDPAIGAEAGLLGKYDLSDSWSLNGMVGYRYLKFSYYAAGKWDDVSTGWLETDGETFYASRFVVYAGVSYRF